MCEGQGLISATPPNKEDFCVPSGRAEVVGSVEEEDLEDLEERGDGDGGESKDLTSGHTAWLAGPGEN